MATIKAWTYTHEGYPSALKLTNIPAPTTSPSPTELHVRVKAAAINPVDIQLMNLPIWPYVPASMSPPVKGIAEDFSGIVEAAGSDSGFKTGDEVFGITFTIVGGTLQEIAVVNTASSVVVKKPSSWSWEQGASLPLVWLTARTTIASVEPDVKNRKVAILGGSSGVGMYAVHLAAARGWDILATCSSRNTDFVKSMGASTVIDYTSKSVPEAVRDFAPDAIIDCVGGTECLNLAKRYVTVVGDKTSRASMGGSLIYYWYPRMYIRMLMGKWGLSELKYDCVNLEFKKEYLEETLEMPHDKIIIDSTWKFDQTKEAFERLNTSRARGKVVITVE